MLRDLCWNFRRGQGGMIWEELLTTSKFLCSTHLDIKGICSLEVIKFKCLERTLPASEFLRQWAKSGHGFLWTGGCGMDHCRGIEVQRNEWQIFSRSLHCQISTLPAILTHTWTYTYSHIYTLACSHTHTQLYTCWLFNQSFWWLWDGCRWS